jgi:hypothetical protein
MNRKSCLVFRGSFFCSSWFACPDLEEHAGKKCAPPMKELVAGEGRLKSRSTSGEARSSELNKQNEGRTPANPPFTGDEHRLTPSKEMWFHRTLPENGERGCLAMRQPRFFLYSFSLDILIHPSA